MTVIDLMISPDKATYVVANVISSLHNHLVFKVPSNCKVSVVHKDVHSAFYVEKHVQNRQKSMS